MATFSAVSNGYYSFDATFGSLGDMAKNYTYFYVQIYSSSGSYLATTSNLTSSSSSYSYTTNITGNSSFKFKAGTQYKLIGKVRYKGADYSVGSAIYVTTNSLPVKPPTPTNFTVYSTTESTISIRWNGSTSANDYGLYLNGVGKGYTTSQYHTFSGLSSYTTYTVSVSARNGAGETTTVGASARTLDNIKPRMTNVSVSGNVSEISISFSGTDVGSGISGFNVYIGTHNGGSSSLTSSKGVVYSSSSGNYKFTTDRNGYSFKAGTYYVGVVAFDKSLNYSDIMTNYITITNPKPASFSWSTSKVSKGNFNITATEWNSFTKRINDFRNYKNLSAYSFTTAYSGSNFTASMYNQTRDAMVNMASSYSLPPYRYTNDEVKASEINQLVSYLNNIS